MPIICNNCGQDLPDDSVFCPKCGTKVTAVRCTGCGAVLTADARFCPSCGTPAEQSKIMPKPDTRMEQPSQAVDTQKISVVPQTAPDKVAQCSSGQTALVDTPKKSPHHFDWKYWSVSILRGYGTTRNSVEVTDENIILTSKLNKRAIYDATTVPLKDIANVEVWEKVSVISSLMIAAVVGLFVGLLVLIPFGVTAIDLSTAEGIGSMVGIVILVALAVWAGFFRMHHWRITIKTHKEPQYRIYEVSAKPQDHELLFQLQKAILDQAKMQGEPVRKKSNKLVLTFIASVIVVLAIVAAMLLSHPQIFETKQIDDTVDKDLIQSTEVKNEPDAQPQGETGNSLPEYGCWVYDPVDMISAAVEEQLLGYNASWDENYQSVTAVAAIADSLETEDVETYAINLGNNWGLGENDMLLMIYNNGNACFWIYNSIMETAFGSDGLDNALDKFEADPWDTSGDSALLNFFATLDDCYAEAYGNLSGNSKGQIDILPISEPLELTYSSGAGAWQTSLTLYSDGSFAGSYYDSDMGDRGENYPNGTIYLCNFSGDFSDITRVNDYTYSMTLENGELYVTTEGGEEWIEDGVRYILMGLSGLDWGTNFRFYTPDAPVSKLPTEFLNWWPGRFDEEPSENLLCYGLYNEDEGNGFFTYE